MLSTIFLTIFDYASKKTQLVARTLIETLNCAKFIVFRSKVSSINRQFSQNSENALLNFLCERNKEIALLTYNLIDLILHRRKTYNVKSSSFT